MADLRREYELTRVKSEMRSQASLVELETSPTEFGNPRYFSLIIGVNDYKFDDENLIDLDQPIQDAKLLAKTLTSKYEFDPEHQIFIENPNRSDIINAFEALSASLTEKDNLLIFYAGHGVWDENWKSVIGFPPTPIPKARQTGSPTAP